jgi:hypothetical protein
MWPHLGVFVKALAILRERQGELTPLLVIAVEGRFRKQLED